MSVDLSIDRDEVRHVVGAVRSGSARALGRLISWIENASPALPMIMKELAPDTGRAHVVGLTGAPGVGKSTTATSLVRSLRARGERVGVLAIDPSSPFSGGALLGDRVRMQEHALDPDVYIRSMATRGHLGGLAAATPQALRAFDAAGFDTVIVETVGVGQSELEVAQTADAILVLLAPGMGDGIQAAKAGILEIGDIFVVNKSDREGARNVLDRRNAPALRGADDLHTRRFVLLARVHVRACEIVDIRVGLREAVGEEDEDRFMEGFRAVIGERHLDAAVDLFQIRRQARAERIARDCLRAGNLRTRSDATHDGD